MDFLDRLSHAWNAFQNKDPTRTLSSDYAGSYTRPDRHKMSLANANTIITPIYNRIAIDVSAIDIEHIRVDENENFVEKIKDSDLNYIFSTEANIDQTSREFIRDVVLSMFDEGCVAIVPVETNVTPSITGAFKIESVRVGKVTRWFPDKVEVEVYNEKKGIKEPIIMLKRTVAIIDNPLYDVMNGQNSILKRLLRKLVLLDQVDEQSSSGKLDLIMQLPYQIRSEARKKHAEERRKELEDQLTNTKYGIGYVDATEKIVQLGHPIENNLLKQVEYLTTLLYSQLGLTEAVFNGTAKEEEYLNYYNRTIEPIISAITEECQRKFLTKTARAQNQRISFFRDPLKLVPINQLADLSNSLSRNEVLTSNELRAVLGFKPSTDPRADQLVNKNITPADAEEYGYGFQGMSDEDFYNQQTQMTDQIDSYLDQMDNMAQSALRHTGENRPAGGYSSKYYDPEKAHEYYEKTKRLKGRRSNAGLNEAGIEAAEYMRNQVDSQHEKELSDLTSRTTDYLEKQDTDLETTVTNIATNLERALEDLKNSTERNKEASRNKLKTVIDNSSKRTMEQTKALYEKISKTNNESAKRGFRNQIEQLRETNAKVKDSLIEGFESDFVKTANEAATKQQQLKEQASSDVTKAKETTASNKETATEAYKQAAADLEEKFGQIIEEEMEKIRNNPEFLEPDKTKKSSGSGKTGRRRLPHGDYLRNIEAYKTRNRKK